MLTQLLTAAVLVTMAAAAGENAAHVPLHDVGQIADALYALLGGAVFVWACSAPRWWRRSCRLSPSRGASVKSQASAVHWPRIRSRRDGSTGSTRAAVIGSAVFVARVPDLLSLNITAQVLNALLLPLVAGWLIALASGTVLPAAERVRGAYRVALIIGVSIACGIGIVGALDVLL